MLTKPTRALVLCNGEPPSRALVKRLAGACDLIVAADGGANTARRYGVRPDVIIGDLDSITLATRRFFSTTPLLHVARQDNTDLEKALDLLAARRARNVVIAGATGGRIDFTLGNLSVLWKYTAFMKLLVVGDGWQAEPVVKRLALSVRVGTVVSLIPFGPCEGVTLTGFAYPLRDASMTIGEIGVSNVVVAARSTVAVQRGHLLLIMFGERVDNLLRHHDHPRAR